MKKTILVTDSGLGGLSVFADIVDHVLEKDPASASPVVTDPSFVSTKEDEISMIYFNAWPEQQRGYNHFPSKAYQADIFNNAMVAMGEFDPDMILIACNTLSVIYPHTEFSRSTAIPVIGIVDHGVDMIFEALTETPDSAVIVFGTPTTTNARSHADALIAKGISLDRIINQGCVDLAGKIERNPFGELVQTLIQDNVLEAAEKIKGSEARIGTKFKKIYAALCCTHFGYRRELFIQGIRQHILENVEILNPNERMAELAIESNFGENRLSNSSTHARSEQPVAAKGSTVKMQVVSRVAWDSQKIGAYTRLFQERSPEVVDALLKHELNPGLFSIEPKM